MVGVKLLLFISSLTFLGIVILFTWCPPTSLCEETSKVIISVAAIAAMRTYKEACDIKWPNCE